LFSYGWFVRVFAVAAVGNAHHRFHSQRSHSIATHLPSAPGCALCPRSHAGTGLPVSLFVLRFTWTVLYRLLGPLFVWFVRVTLPLHWFLPPVVATGGFLYDVCEPFVVVSSDVLRCVPPRPSCLFAGLGCRTFGCRSGHYTG
jgi:hypothetical protein